jgi:hypothetical protein
VFSKLLICGGVTNYYADTSEAYDLKSISSSCKPVTNLPMRIASAVGGLGFNKNPVICGGWQNEVFSDR